MQTRELTCIGCPLGCRIQVQLQDGQICRVSGNTCKNGENYARKELTNPTRIVTTTVRVDGGHAPVVSVKTACDIPKDQIFQCLAELKQVCLCAPVSMGQTVLADVAGTGVRVITTKAIAKA